LFDPVIVTPRKYDMITFTGMIRIAQLVTGRSSQYFTFFASGTGVSEEKLSDSRLQAENFRVSMVSDCFCFYFQFMSAFDVGLQQSMLRSDIYLCQLLLVYW
jgi:hypothetical protein